MYQKMLNLNLFAYNVVDISQRGMSIYIVTVNAVSIALKYVHNMIAISCILHIIVRPYGINQMRYWQT